MSSFHIHQSNSAQSGPPPDQKGPPPKTPAPRWLHFLWLIGLGLTILILFTPSSASKVTTLTFSDWRGHCDARFIKTATIAPSGKVTGSFVKGGTYTPRIPTAVHDDTLLSDLTQHQVTVNAVGNSTSIW